MMALRQRIAFVVALTALGLLGWRAWHPRPAPAESVTVLTLWTPGATPPVPGVAGLQHALSDALAVPAEVARVPDVAFLRRMYPALRRIEILGDGVTPAEAEALHDLEVKWHPASASFPSPAIVALSVPRTISVGQRLRVEGCVGGLRADGVTTLRMEGPDGGSQSVELRGGADGEAAFAVTSNPAAAVGTYEWNLQLGPTGTPLRVGAQVVRPELPRVLLLQASPDMDTGRLQRWLAEAGAPVASRTRVSTERMRFATANDAPGEFARVEPELLKNFDVVVTTEAAILDLTVAERNALADTVRSRGLGVLVTGEAASPRTGDSFIPWQLKPDTTVEAGEDTRVARLRLADGTELAEPITTLASELVTVPLERWLVRDAQDRVVGVAQPRGRGWIARSLVVDTWRWLQGGHPEVFAAYWSAVLTAVAPPASAGRWHLNGRGAPIFVHAPVRLAWVGSAEAGPLSAKITPRGRPEVEMALTRDTADPARFVGVFYPAQTGWHEVRTASDAWCGFYVYGDTILRELRTTDRRAATAGLVAASDRQLGTETSVPADISRWREVLAFWIFVASAAVLFLDKRSPPTMSGPVAQAAEVLSSPPSQE